MRQRYISKANAAIAIDILDDLGRFVNDHRLVKTSLSTPPHRVVGVRHNCGRVWKVKLALELN